MAKSRILVIDDEALMREYVEEALVRHGYDVTTATNGRDGLQLLRAKGFDAVVTDLKMTPVDGLEVVRRIREEKLDTRCIVMTAYGTIETAVAALKDGAEDYILKPFSPDVLELAVARALERGRVAEENRYLRAQLNRNYDCKALVGKSAAMRKVYAEIEKIASSRATVLVRGESGTGKELVAHALHYNGPRADRPFIKVNCAALSAGLLESELFGHVKGSFTGAIKDRIGKIEEANGGTLFLDDIDDIPLELQVKLLRFLQEGEIQRIGSNKTIKLDIKVIAATKKDLLELSEKGLFREDLYYRLNVLPINLKPIRERLEDVPILFQYFANLFSKKNININNNVFEVLKNYNWRGNIREIKNIAERTVILSNYNTIELNNLPIEIIQNSEFSKFEYGTKSLNEYLAEIEIQLLKEALQKCENNKTRAAELLKIPLNTLRSKLEKYGIVE